jgi:hypothetical protein
VIAVRSWGRAAGDMCQDKSIKRQADPARRARPGFPKAWPQLFLGGVAGAGFITLQ